MHTARVLPVSPSMHCLGGCPGDTWSWGCTWSQEGCTWSRGVYLVSGGVPGLRGVYLVPGGTCPGTPLPMNRMTDRCKNITLPQTSFADICLHTAHIWKLPNYHLDWFEHIESTHFGEYHDQFLMDFLPTFTTGFIFVRQLKQKVATLWTNKLASILHTYLTNRLSQQL